MEIDVSKLNEKDEELKVAIKSSEDMINEVVNSTINDLDSLMTSINTDVIIADEPDIATIEHYFLMLSNAIYFASSKVEELGLYDSMSKISYKVEYNNNYLNPNLEKQKPTVAELTANAENESLYDLSLNDIYNKAYKICKTKIDAAQTMVSSLSKVISRRMNEMNLSSMQPTTPISNRQVLNEDNVF